MLWVGHPPQDRLVMSVRGGDGLGGSADGFQGLSQHGLVTGTGVTLGVGAGAGGFVGTTQTNVYPIVGKKTDSLPRQRSHTMAS